MTQKTTWWSFYCLANSGTLLPGDILFFANPVVTVQLSHSLGFEHLFSNPFTHNMKETSSYQFTHVAIAAKPKGSSLLSNQTFIAESTEPTSRVEVFDSFFRNNRDSSVCIFRTPVTSLREEIAHCAYYFASRNIPYTPTPRSLVFPAPRQMLATILNMPHSTNASSFVSFVYNYAFYSLYKSCIDFSGITSPFFSSCNTPTQLFEEFQKRLREGGTWTKVLYAAQ